MKKIMLINLKSGDFRQNSYPLGLAYISSALKDCSKVDVFDLNILSVDILFSSVINENYDVIAFSCYTGSLDQASNLAKQIKEINNYSLIIIGGYHATAEYRNILMEHKEFDMALIGRGEKIFIDLIACLEKGLDYINVPSIAYKCNNEIIVTRSNKEVLDIIPDRSTEENYFINTSEEKIACIATMRGCYHNCAFCSITRNEFISFYSENTIREDLNNIVNIGANSLYFVNPDFFSNRECLEKTLMLIRENPEIKSFKISARSDSVLRNKDMLETLLKIGCNSIEIGVESYSDQQLKRYNKKVTAQENIDCYKILYKLSKQYNFRLIHELIPFDPWVTKEDLTKTVDFYINNNFEYLELEPWLFTKLILYPNTKLRFLAEKDHLISKDNHEELPHWDFVEEDVACIYSSMQKYKHIFLPQIESLRQVINKLLASETLILNRKLICLSIQKKLSKITLVFFHNLLEQQTIQDLPSCLLQISNTIKQYSEKINEIKEYKNEQ